mmetsp:Transcript_26440/g.39099  ORF Transcript_26440/g.39099 Transcript_26440/m.39099 type:complete len:376 (-) Transcript_26440:1902-3029(-)
MPGSAELPNYMDQHLSPSLIEKLQAGAFRSLCQHLKDHSNEVQNIDLMAVSGFCRNCLAKWIVMEARDISASMSQDTGETGEEVERIIQMLDALGYDEAAQNVYGCNYEDWKKKHAKKASDEQMQKYNDSKSLHSIFDKKVLEVKAEKPENLSPTLLSKKKEVVTRSNVCCQDVDELVAKSNDIQEKESSSILSFVPPPPPEGGLKFSVAILTVSDRAYNAEYQFGDLSGPAVHKSVRECVESLDSENCPTACEIKDVVIVPDDKEEIQSKLTDFSLKDKVDLIFTTGGTGFATRDVTPEATVGVVDRECHGLMSFVANECSKQQPLATLSRGTAGILGATMICNLPGNPKGVQEIIPILLPILVHGIRDLQVSN